jgi:hypothetical protein
MNPAPKGGDVLPGKAVCESRRKDGEPQSANLRAGETTTKPRRKPKPRRRRRAIGRCEDEGKNEEGECSEGQSS